MRATVSFPYDIVHLPRHILYLEAMPEGSEHSYQNGFGGGLDRGDRGDRAGRGGTQTSAAAGDPIFDRVPPHDVPLVHISLILMINIGGSPGNRTPAQEPCTPVCLSTLSPVS